MGKIRLFSLRFWRSFAEFLIISSNTVLEDFVLYGLKASPHIKPLLTCIGSDGMRKKCVYLNVSVGLKCMRTSSTDSFLNLSQFYTLVSKNVVSVSDI